MKNAILTALAVFAAVCVTTYASLGLASRNSSGSYTLYTPGNPVVTNTTITTSWANNTLADLSTEVTNSLDRNGRGGMLAPLRGVDGTVAAPAFSWTSEVGTGFYRIGANDIGFAVAGVKIWEFTAAGVTLPAGKTLTNTVTLTVPSVTAPWVAQSGLGYFKGIDGVVHFKGGVSCPAGCTGAAFTLPAGLRPNANQSFLGLQSTSNAVWTVDTAGGVTVNTLTPANGTVWLDQGMFLAEQ